jgi:TusA-related sulfurtransferase
VSEITPDVIVDARETTSPAPLAVLSVHLRRGEAGTVYELLTTDGVSNTDVPEWLDQVGHELLDVVEHAEYCSIFVEKTKQREPTSPRELTR